MPTITIRPAERRDCALIAALVRELADYEREPAAARLTAEDFERDGFDLQPPAFECLIGEIDGEGSGLALFFPCYSTWEGRGIYLEDLFVRPSARGRGLGRAQLAEVARLAVTRGAVRLDWSVLAWNEPALGFYHSLGAERLEEWRKMRLSGPALAACASQQQILRSAQDDGARGDHAGAWAGDSGAGVQEDNAREGSEIEEVSR